MVVYVAHFNANSRSKRGHGKQRRQRCGGDGEVMLGPVHGEEGDRVDIGDDEVDTEEPQRGAEHHVVADRRSQLVTLHTSSRETHYPSLPFFPSPDPPPPSPLQLYGSYSRLQTRSLRAFANTGVCSHRRSHPCDDDSPDPAVANLSVMVFSLRSVKTARPVMSIPTVRVPSSVSLI
jgi:hypothetical protein